MWYVFYALFLLRQLACFIITVYIGQLLVHFVPCCPVQLLYVKWSCRCDCLFEQINDDDDNVAREVYMLNTVPELQWRDMLPLTCMTTQERNLSVR